MASSQTRAVETVRAKMMGLRRACDTEIANHQQKIDSTFVDFANSLQSLRSKTELTANNQVKLGNLKAELRELEDELVRALAVKTRKEAKRMAVSESLSETKLKVDELQKIVQDQAARKDEYAAILSQQSEALVDSEEKSQEVFQRREDIQEAFTWYNRVLGFRIDGGHGVKFTFTNINRKCPSEEYSFIVRHANELYTLLDCKPHLNDTEELVQELNKTNALFKFVRIMREKFQAAASGSMSHFIYEDQECTSVSLSAPVSSVSTDSRSKSPLPLREANRDVKKANYGKGVKSPLLSPSVRRSPRLLVRKQREG